MVTYRNDARDEPALYGDDDRGAATLTRTHAAAPRRNDDTGASHRHGEAPPNDNSHPLADRFRLHVRDRAFPCVGAKSAEARDQMRFVIARDMRSAWDDLRIYRSLLDYAMAYRENLKLFQSFVVIFEAPEELSEEIFEARLWDRLQSLTDKDAWHGQDYDDRVSADPESPHFSLSFGGEAFFVVGLHPGASRPARRFEKPALVFNVHDQFERLRAEDRYEPLRRSIVERDVVLAGDVNPMLARHGEVSEARQYSGRRVEADWRCPFTPNPKVGHDE